MAGQVKFQASPCGICSGQSCSETGFFFTFLSFYLSVSFFHCSTFIPISLTFYNQHLSVSLNNTNRYGNRNIPLYHALNTTYIFKADNLINLH